MNTDYQDIKSYKKPNICENLCPNVSEFLQPTENMDVFWGFRICPGNGIMEWWNIGFQKDVNHFNFIINPAGGGIINPTFDYPRTRYFIIPLFQHSNIPIGAKPLSSGYFTRIQPFYRIAMYARKCGACQETLKMNRI